MIMTSRQVHLAMSDWFIITSVVYIYCLLFPDGDQLQLLASVFCAQGRGRRPTLPELQGKATNLLLLQIHHIKQIRGSSWETVETWMASLFPDYPRTKSRYLIEKCVQGVQRIQKREDRDSYYTVVTDLNIIGK